MRKKPSNTERQPEMSVGTAPSSRLKSTVGSRKNRRMARATPSTPATPMMTPVSLSPRWSVSHWSSLLGSSSSPVSSVILSAERERAL